MVAFARKDPPTDDANPPADPAKTAEPYKVPALAVATFVDARRKGVAVWANPLRGAAFSLGRRGPASKRIGAKRGRS